MQSAVTALAFVLVLLVSCAEQPMPVEATEEQGLCTIEDQQTGACELRRRTTNYASSLGGDPTNVTWHACDSVSCIVQIDLPYATHKIICTPTGCVSNTCSPDAQCPWPNPA